MAEFNDPLEQTLSVNRPRRRGLLSQIAEGLLFAGGGAFAPEQTIQAGKEFQRRRSVVGASPFVARKLGVTPEEAIDLIESGLVDQSSLFRGQGKFLPATKEIEEASGGLVKTGSPIPDYEFIQYRQIFESRQKEQLAEKGRQSREIISALSRASTNERAADTNAKVMELASENAEQKGDVESAQVLRDMAAMIRQGQDPQIITLTRPDLIGTVGDYIRQFLPQTTIGKVRKAVPLDGGGTGKPSGRIRVISPDGRTGTIPADKLKEKLKQGYKRAD